MCLTPSALRLVFVYTQKVSARKNNLDAYLRKSVVDSKAVSIRRNFVRSIFSFLTSVLLLLSQRRLAFLKERSPSIPVIPSHGRKPMVFFQKLSKVVIFKIFFKSYPKIDLIIFSKTSRFLPSGLLTVF